MSETEDQTPAERLLAILRESQELAYQIGENLGYSREEMDRAAAERRAAAA